MSRRTAVALAGLAVVAVLLALRFGRTRPPEEVILSNAAVHVSEIRRATVHRTVTAYGRVEPAPATAGQPAGGALLTPFVDGVLAEVNGVEGQHVKKGTVLFRLDGRMAGVAVERARQLADFAEASLQRQETLRSADGTSERAYLEARQLRDDAASELAAAKTSLSYLSLAAPLSGTLIQLNAEIGQHVDQTTSLAQIVALDRLVVTAGVPTREMAGVALGQEVQIGSGNSVTAGKVTVLGQDVDLATGTYRVKASLPPDAGFLPGQFTEIFIVVEEHSQVLVVPEASVVTSPDEGNWIVVVEGEESAVRRPVTVGLREGGLVEVAAEGLAEGLRIVTDEAYSLPEESRVRVVSD